MPKKYVKKADRVAAELQTEMTKNQVGGDVTRVDFGNREQAEESLRGTERFQSLSKEEQDAALAKIRNLASGKNKNQDLPGMVGEGVARIEHPEVEEAVEEYTAHLEQRQASLKLEVEAKKTLLAIMKAKGLEKYETNGGALVAVKAVDATETIKIVKPKKNEIEIDDED